MRFIERVSFLGSVSKSEKNQPQHYIIFYIQGSSFATLDILSIAKSVLESTWHGVSPAAKESCPQFRITGKLGSGTAAC